MEVFVVSYFTIPKRPDRGQQTTKLPPRLHRADIVAADLHGRFLRNEDLEREADNTSLYWRTDEANVFLPCIWRNPDTGNLQYANRESYGDVGTDSPGYTPRYSIFTLCQARWLCNRNLGLVGYANWLDEITDAGDVEVVATIFSIGTGACAHAVSPYQFRTKLDKHPGFVKSAIGNDGTVLVCRDNWSHALALVLSSETGEVLQPHAVLPTRVCCVFAAPVAGYIIVGRHGPSKEPLLTYWNPRCDPRAERLASVPVGVATDVDAAIPTKKSTRKTSRIACQDVFKKNALALFCVQDPVFNSLSRNGFFVTDEGWHPLQCATFRVVTAERAAWVTAVVCLSQ